MTVSADTKVSRISDEEQHGLVRLVNDIHLAFDRLFNHQASSHGLTNVHWRVIGGLYRHDGMTQTELANYVAMSRSPLGKVVDRLEEKDLIERLTDPDDRRVNRLRLTLAGEALIKPARRLNAQIEEKALASLSDSQRQRLFEQLAKVRDALFTELDDETISWDETP